MSSHDNDELIDYEDENDVVPNGATLAASGGANADDEKDKKNFSGIHSTGFRDFLLKPELLRAISDLGFEHPSEVQQECIPQAVLGMDVLCQAKSGHGKTAVFVLATLQQLEPVNGEVSVIVLCHTRELAYQIKNEYTRFAKYMPDVRVGTFFGGTPVSKDADLLKDKSKCPHIVVATPGRLNALVRDKVLDAKNVKHFVLDECDKMLEQLDMRRDVQEIFRATPHHKQVMMFSATLAKDIRVTCKKFMANPLEIFVDDETKLTLHGLQQHYVKLEEVSKNRKLNDLLDTLEFNQVVIFVKSVARAIELDKLLVSCNFPSISIHSGLAQEERIKRYTAFKAFEKRILVATDIFGRGIDVERVNIVVNYDCPPDADSYLHRVGRAGRFGTKGLAITFVSSEADQQVMGAIQSRFEVAVPELPDHIDPASYIKAMSWEDTGSLTQLAEGSSLKDGSNVIAKIAPANTNASVCLQREAHILARMQTSPEALSTTLRPVDLISISRSNGDCVVLLTVHPGPNLLGRYLPLSRINALLLAEPPSSRLSTAQGDVFMNEVGESFRDIESTDTMDLATFLEFAIQATHCLENLHRLGIVHREVRANAYHINAHSGVVRLVHYGNRSVSLESSGGPSTLVIQADGLGEENKSKVKEALCYLSPEQTGSMETTSDDYRTDLYSLGVMFWTLLVGRGMLPFEGGPLEILHAIAQKRPMPVHEVRRDVPQVLAQIIDKLLSKNPDSRYQSAYGLKADLLDCQKRLSIAVSSLSEVSSELIPPFDIAKQDRYTFGREKELETIRNVIRHASTSYSRHNILRGTTYSTPVGSQRAISSERSRRSSSLSSLSRSSAAHPATCDEPGQTKSAEPSSSVTAATSSVNTVSDGIRRITLSPPRGRGPRAHGVVVVGPAGVGKSSLILANQVKWRAYGLWGHAKFQSTTSAPFAALLSCLSSVLRQLMVFHTDLHRFVTTLKTQLGPQLRIVPLLYEGVPELRDILHLFDISLDIPQETLTTSELRARSLDLVNTLACSRSHILVFITLREDKPEIVSRVRSMFFGRSRATWIQLDPLTYSSVASLVSRTLRQSKDKVAPLARLIHGISAGNAFSVRNLLMTLQRQHLVSSERAAAMAFAKYDLPEIERTLLSQKLVVNPNDISYLTSHLRKLPGDARKYLVWASCFGATFRTTDVVAVMDHDSPSGSSGSDLDTEENRSSNNSVSIPREKSTSTARRSMRGLQIAIDEGWLVQRARDMCSFAHDRYRQAAEAEALSLQDDLIAKMSFRGNGRVCLPLLREHNKRGELVSLLIDAGDSAWARGAHEMAYQSLVNAQSLLEQEVWTTNPTRTFSLYTKLAEYIEACYERASHSDERAFLLRLRSQNNWMRNEFNAALEDTLLALHILGVDLDPSPTLEMADTMFEQVKGEILAVGFDTILAIPRTSEPRTDLAVTLLGDAGTHAYWSTGEGFPDVIGLTVRFASLSHDVLVSRVPIRRFDWLCGSSGMSPGTALGFFWALGAAAERKELYRFSVDLGRLALRIAERHGTNADRCRSLVMYCSMVSAYDNVHIRSNLSRLEEATKYANSAGDRMYACLANFYSTQTKLFIGQPRMSCSHSISRSPKLLMSGPVDELVGAAEETYNDIQQWAQGELAICAQGLLNCIRALGGYTVNTSATTIYTTDTFNEDNYLESIPDGEGSTLIGLTAYNAYKVVALFNLGYVQEAAQLGFSIYDTRNRHPNHRHTRYALFFHSLAMIACIREEFVTEDERTRYLEQIEANQIYIRRWLSASPVNTSTWVTLVDAELLSLEDSRDAFQLYDAAVRSATNHDWPLEEGWAVYLALISFAAAAVGYPSSDSGEHEALCQVMVGINGHKTMHEDPGADITEEEAVTSLPASALASVLKWSKDIAADIHLFSALQRLTEIAFETSGAQSACIAITGTGGEYRVATSMTLPGPCKERVAYDDISSDSRFSSEAHQSPYQSVVCLPIFSNRGQTFGALYLASKYAFSQNTITLLTLLCQQANISIANALLFHSVQAGTKENLRMISAQKEALEDARQSREDALKATRIKSNFLASMSHELRTPFSSFYGLLDILSGTELNNGQREIADCMELLLPMAAKKLDLSFNIDRGVPASCLIFSVLMNLIGNAVKFTPRGSVKVLCSLDNERFTENLTESLRDTGIGLSSSDVDLLFVPFQQADNSSTRRFGGTGLGLSICRQLVKLMGGVIGVHSELGKGSTFWFIIPVKIFGSEDSEKAMLSIERVRAHLMEPRPLRALISSPSDATTSLLCSMLDGFHVSTVLTVEELEQSLRSAQPSDAPLDCIILDHQAEAAADGILRLLESLCSPVLKDTKLIHFHTPVTDTTSSNPVLGNSTSGIIRITKPPRKARLLQALAKLRKLPPETYADLRSAVISTAEEPPESQRTLFGNILIAEDNPVAQKLLVKQLQRYDLNVIATSNGEEAIAEFERHDPGYFSLAMFDHRMCLFGPLSIGLTLRFRYANL
ncbi:hypothetical protein BJV74DRAFT_875326 [Russula compacta]|nr:hypothetical protein BJV74DRAFT_875326 [Russula compacta]